MVIMFHLTIITNPTAVEKHQEGEEDTQHDPQDEHTDGEDHLQLGVLGKEGLLGEKVIGKSLEKEEQLEQEDIIELDEYGLQLMKNVRHVVVPTE